MCSRGFFVDVVPCSKAVLAGLNAAKEALFLTVATA
jgi:hypothetical protein